MNKILLIMQIAVSAALVIFILVQQRGTALGSAFGGEGGTFYLKKRGFEKTIFYITIILAILFIVLSLANLIA